MPELMLLGDKMGVFIHIRIDGLIGKVRNTEWRCLANIAYYSLILVNLLKGGIIKHFFGLTKKQYSCMIK